MGNSTICRADPVWGGGLGGGGGVWWDEGLFDFEKNVYSVYPGSAYR